MLGKILGLREENKD
jgi:hypothetical protein